MLNIIKAFGFPLAEGIWLHIVRYFKRNEVSSSKRDVISMPKDRSTDYCWRYCLLHRLSRSETLRLRNQSELSRLTWRERSFLKVSRCRDWSRPVIGRAIAGRRTTLALWDLAVPELGVATFLMPQTSQQKTKETNEAKKIIIKKKMNSWFVI